MQGELIRERAKLIVGLPPQSLVTTNKTSRYYPMKGYDKVVFLIACGAIAYADPGTPNTVVAQVMRAKSAAAGSAEALTGFAATITGQIDAIKGSVLVDTVTNDVTITINGVVYTKKAATNAAAAEFADAAGLVLCVNHATEGVPGVLAAAVGTTVYLTSIVPDDTKIDMVGYEAAKLVPATEEGLALIEVDELNLGDTWTHMAIKLTTVGTIVASASMLFADARRGPVSQFLTAQYPA
jgi:hypothetical protein